LEQSPLEANSHSASHEILRLLYNPKVHYRVRKRSSPVLILSQMHPVHNFPSYVPKIHSNIILPSMAMSSEWSLTLRFSDQNCVCISHLFHACYMLRPSHPP